MYPGLGGSGRRGWRPVANSYIRASHEIKTRDPTHQHSCFILRTCSCSRCFRIESRDKGLRRTVHDTRFSQPQENGESPPPNTPSQTTQWLLICEGRNPTRPTAPLQGPQPRTAKDTRKRKPDRVAKEGRPKTSSTPPNTLMTCIPKLSTNDSGTSQEN